MAREPAFQVVAPTLVELGDEVVLVRGVRTGAVLEGELPATAELAGAAGERLAQQRYALCPVGGECERVACELAVPGGEARLGRAPGADPAQQRVALGEHPGVLVARARACGPDRRDHLVQVGT